MGAKGSAEAAAKLNADNWGHLEVCVKVVEWNMKCFSYKFRISISSFEAKQHSNMLISIKLCLD